MENIIEPVIGSFYTYYHGDFTNLSLCYRIDKDYLYFIEHDLGGDCALWFDRVTRERFKEEFSKETYTDYDNFWQMDCFRIGLVWLFTERRYNYIDSDFVTEQDISDVEKAVQIFNKESGIKDKLGQYKLDYSKYLKTPHWKKVRDLKLRECEHKCQLCGSKVRLEVHHNSYEHLWLEEMYMNDLVVLCHRCHAKFHDKIED